MQEGTIKCKTNLSQECHPGSTHIVITPQRYEIGNTKFPNQTFLIHFHPNQPIIKCAHSVTQTPSCTLWLTIRASFEPNQVFNRAKWLDKSSFSFSCDVISSTIGISSIVLSSSKSKFKSKSLNSPIASWVSLNSLSCRASHLLCNNPNLVLYLILTRVRSCSLMDMDYRSLGSVSHF